MVSPGDAAMDALYDQMDAHYRDRDPDCTCWDCRLIQAMDRNDVEHRESGAFVRSLTRPQRVRIVPVNRQHIK